MRRIAFLIVCLSLIFSIAVAEVYCICGLTRCRCFIQEGDEGRAVEAIQNALVSQGYLPPNDDATIFDAKTTVAVKAFQEKHGLSVTGMMDDATLTLLLWGMLPEEVDAVQPGSIGLPVWIPTDGGIRHHDWAGCCNMYDPRLVSHRNAMEMNMLACGRCKPNGDNTELIYPF